jgi:hypothetical protein
MSTRTFAFCLAIALLAWGSPALAHVVEPPAAAPTAGAPPDAASVTDAVSDATALIAGGPTAAGLWTVLAAVVLAATAIARRRRAVAVVFVALLMLIAFEAGLHSVHHIGDHGDASCVIASASAHAGALVVERVAFERPAHVTTAVVGDIDTATTARVSSPDLGRAPPAA